MSNTERIDKKLFREDHYLGKPAEDNDKIVTRRIEILKTHPEFFDKSLDLIEVGCGTGSTITKIASEFNTCLGVDIYDYSDSFADNIKINGADNCSFLKIDLEKEHLPRAFDRLICFEVIEHFKNEESVQVLSELLKPGGLAAITVPNKWWIFETHGAKLPLLPWNRVPLFSWLPTVIHERFANARIYTRSRITRLLKRYGFEITSTGYVTAPMDVLKDGRLKRFLVKNIFRQDTTNIPILATSVFILAKKSILIADADKQDH